MAVKLSDNEYNLILSNDINTNGHTQWFFFRVTNTKKDHWARFNIINLSKPDSLFNYGMKVLVFSEAEAQKGWFRGGRDISYYKNCFAKIRANVGNPKFYYSATFTYDFTRDNDTIYFAYSQPYTYSDLREDLEKIQKNPEMAKYVSRNTLCRTIAGNKCEYLTITARDNPDNKIERKGVFVSARVHPGETNSSWMMKGLIDFLVSEHVEAKILREHFVFKIVPMINPDGVINGNYRCSLSGGDLNRRYKNPSKDL